MSFKTLPCGWVYNVQDYNQKILDSNSEGSCSNFYCKLVSFIFQSRENVKSKDISE